MSTQWSVTRNLRAEHAQMTRQCEELAVAATPEARQYLMDEIERAFRAHHAAEDALIAEAMLGDAAQRLTALVESAAQAESLVAELLREIAAMFPWARGYEEEVGRIVAQLLAHFRWEEDVLFPVLEEAASGATARGTRRDHERA